MEILFWIQPGTELLMIFSGLLALVFGGSAIGHYVLSNDDDVCKNPAHTQKTSKQHMKITLVLLVMAVCLSPIANVDNAYKKVLIYRGINSVLVDKTVDTAEKALDVLNVKLDEMVKQNAKKN